MYLTSPLIERMYALRYSQTRGSLIKWGYKRDGEEGEKRRRRKKKKKEEKRRKKKK